MRVDDTAKAVADAVKYPSAVNAKRGTARRLVCLVERNPERRVGDGFGEQRREFRGGHGRGRCWPGRCSACKSFGAATVLLTGLETFALIATVFAAVYHAEVVAHRVGEPFGSLVLALAVTIIEVALIVSVMIMGGDATGRLARDTVFAAVMIVCNGIVGLCLLAGGMRHGEQGFQLRGANAALSVLIALTTLTMVFPNVTTSTVGPTFSPSQLVFAAVVSLVLYGAFVFIQTIRHRDYFLPASGAERSMLRLLPIRWRC